MKPGWIKSRRPSPALAHPKRAEAGTLGPAGVRTGASVTRQRPAARRAGGSELPRCRSPVPIVTLHRTPGLIQAIIWRVIFVDDDCWWRWCVWLNDNADAGADVRLIGEFPAQPAAEYPRNQNQGQPGEREKQINTIILNDGIQEIKNPRPKGVVLRSGLCKRPKPRPPKGAGPMCAVPNG